MDTNIIKTKNMHENNIPNIYIVTVISKEGRNGFNYILQLFFYIKDLNCGRLLFAHLVIYFPLLMNQTAVITKTEFAYPGLPCRLRWPVK